MMSIDWRVVSPQKLEKLVAVLLSHIYPTASRVDATTPSDPDIQIVTDTERHVFEVKKLSGKRLSSRSRAAIEKGLQRAAALGATDWTLIVPTDLDPREEQWIDSLRERASIPVDVLDRSWLEAQLSTRPYVANYFLGSGAEEVGALDAEMVAAQKRLGTGLPDALDAAGKLAERLNNLDPFYRFEIRVGGESQSVTAIPRYRGAQQDRPIAGDFRFRFTNDAQGQAAADAFKRAMEFGVPARIDKAYIEDINIDLPGGFGAGFTPSAIEIGPAKEQRPPQTFVLASESPGGERIAELPLEFELESIGSRGSIWIGIDRTGTLSARLTLDMDERRANVTMRLRPAEMFYPTEMVPVSRFLAAWAPPNRFALYTESGTRLGEFAEAPTDPWLEKWFPQFVEDLVLIQSAAQMSRRVPGRISAEEIQNVGATAALLRGETVEGTWDRLTMAIHSQLPAAERIRLITPGIPLTLVTHQQHELTFAGVSYPLGRRARMHYLSAKADAVFGGEGVEPKPIPAEWRNGDIPSGTELILVPGETNVARLTLISTVGELSPADMAPILDTPATEAPDAADDNCQLRLDAVLALAPGRKSAGEYHRAVEQLLTCLFAPSLRDPHVEVPIDGGRKRIDITYTNVAVSGFFQWLTYHYKAPFVFVECKNYEKDVSNSGLDQLTGRFSPNRGTFGLLVSRSFHNKPLFIQRCRDAMNAGRGHVLALDDADLELLVAERKTGSREANHLTRRFRELVM